MRLPARGSWWGVILTAALSAGCDAPGRPDPAGRPVPADQVMSFAVLFKTHCAGCHGADGKLGPAPPLNDPLFRAIVPAEELEMTIHAGRPGTPMPAFAQRNGGMLTPAQIQVLANEIKGIPYRVVVTGSGTNRKTKVELDAAGTAPQWGTPPAVAGAPPYEAPDAAGDPAKGARVFASACASCHGADGKEQELRINDPSFLALISDQALRRYVITGRPDLGMPDYRGKKARPADFRMTADDVTNVVALVASWRSGTGK